MSLEIELVSPTGYKVPLNTGLFINNEFVSGAHTIDTINPSTGKLITSVQAAETEQVNAAVDAAEKAFHGGWKTSNPRERARLMNKLADLIERDAEDIAQLEALDNGKPFGFSYAVEIPLVLSQFRYFAGFCDKLHGKVIETEGKLSYTVHEPIGVCAGIIPWNVGAIMFSWKVAPAICCGNTIIVKTSEITPLSALKLAALVKEAGFPPGVINIITGYGPTAGEALSRHMKISKVSFTGSLPTGRAIMKAAAETNLKQVTLELGGKSPNIIFDDVEDLDKAVWYSLNGIYAIGGQVCFGGSRLYIQEGIYDAFLEKFKAMAAARKVCDPFSDRGAEQGPQVSETQFKRVLSYIESGKAEGATLYHGGVRKGDTGYFIEPTIFTDVTPDMRIMKEEIFGPVVSITKFKDEDDVIAQANNTTYGLAAGVFTSNVKRAITVSNALEAGTVWVNCYMEIDSSTPFGGYKQSGLGREGGEYVLQDYTQVKAIKINIGL